MTGSRDAAHAQPDWVVFGDATLVGETKHFNHSVEADEAWKRIQEVLLNNWAHYLPVASRTRGVIGMRRPGKKRPYYGGGQKKITMRQARSRVLEAYDRACHVLREQGVDNPRPTITQTYMISGEGKRWFRRLRERAGMDTEWPPQHRSCCPKIRGQRG